jgi:hypothetical protein
MKKILLISLVAAAAGCGSGISGEYGGDDCLYDKLVFKGDGTVYMTFMGMEVPAQYKVDGDKVSLTSHDGKGLVFTKNGSVLEAGFLGEKMICEKL